ncbi:MAG: DUF5615 family PIN-like protein [Armatimonadetes bacterium]|nr:DUF5615 family PIN-like protein [Armatimonadota bacterium]
MRRRVYLDDSADSRRLRRELETRGFEVEAPGEAGLRGADDSAHLAHARETGRTIVTYNAGDYHSLHRSAGDHAGIAVVYFGNTPRDMRPAEIAEALRRAWRALGDLDGQFVVLNQWRRGRR